MLYSFTFVKYATYSYQQQMQCMTGNISDDLAYLFLSLLISFSRSTIQIIESDPASGYGPDVWAVG